MARIITKERAVKIARKLGAEMRPEKAHDIAEVFENGKLIAHFGIRRGSEKDKGHDHVLNDLHVNGHYGKLLAACPLTRQNWLEILRKKGLA
jgi:hypothetical protein